MEIVHNKDENSLNNISFVLRITFSPDHVSDLGAVDHQVYPDSFFPAIQSAFITWLVLVTVVSFELATTRDTIIMWTVSSGCTVTAKI